MSADEKKCGRCQTTKPASDFTVNTRKGDGLHGYCRACVAAAASERYHAKLALDPEFKRKKRVMRKIERALETGALIKPATCPVCSTATPSKLMWALILDDEHPVEAHEWMCASCHAQASVSRRNTTVSLTCECCTKPLERFAHEVENGLGRYCSPECRNIAQTGVNPNQRGGTSAVPGPATRARLRSRGVPNGFTLQQAHEATTGRTARRVQGAS
jgi:hypothetical protein